jgi:hypothetical protein
MHNKKLYEIAEEVNPLDVNCIDTETLDFIEAIKSDSQFKETASHL